LVNPPWNNGIKPSHLLKMGLEKYVKDGIIMMWIEKNYFVEMLKGFEQSGLSYVENLTWVTLDKERKDETN
jgi:hypothetical protein